VVVCNIVLAQFLVLLSSLPLISSCLVGLRIPIYVLDDLFFCNLTCIPFINFNKFNSCTFAALVIADCYASQIVASK